MTPPCSQWQGEAHLSQHSTPPSEPPIEASIPLLDEGVTKNQGSLEDWGNLMGIKQTMMLHVAFQNIGSFSDEEMDLKFEVMHRFVTNCKIDVFGFTKMNTCWDLLSEQDWLARWTQSWWESSQWCLSYNCTILKDANNTPYQPRGADILCVNQVTHQMMKLCNDPWALAGGVGLLVNQGAKSDCLFFKCGLKRPGWEQSLSPASTQYKKSKPWSQKLTNNFATLRKTRIDGIHGSHNWLRHKQQPGDTWKKPYGSNYMQ